MSFEFKFPDVGEGIHEGKIVDWLVKEGDVVEAEKAIAEVETDKAVVEIPSPVSGTIVKINRQKGELIQVGEVLAVIEEARAKAGGAKTKKSASAEQKRESAAVVGALEESAPGVMKAPDLAASGAVFTAPSAVRPKSSGKTPEPSAVQPEPSVESPQSPAVSKGVGVVKEGFKQTKKFDFFGYIDRVPYEGVRKAVGDHMVKSMYTIPHVTHTDMADVTDLWDLREKEKSKAEKKGVKLTFLPFFVKAVAEALKLHPFINAELNEGEASIILKKYYNIGIAVDTIYGLMVPVIKGADTKTVYQLAEEIDDLAQKARSRKINPMDMKGGTFTITNIGSAGGGWFATPVIHYPQAAVLATGMIMDMAVPLEGKVRVRKMLPLSLAFDHRVLDGAAAARFVNELKTLLGKPTM